MRKLAFVIIILGLTALACVSRIENLINYQEDKIIFSDDFSYPLGGWERIDMETYQANYKDGVYHLLISEPFTSIWSLKDLISEDVLIDVDTTKAGGSDDNYYGVICRANKETGNFYFFIISSDGYYSIGKVIGGEQVLLGESVMQPSEYIRKGYATNHIRAACVEDMLSLSVNGQELMKVLDDEYSIGGVGLIAGSFEVPGVEIYFDNFVVEKP